MTFYPDTDSSVKSSFAGSTLIIPSVSLANLPQLCVDLIISSLGLKRVGWIGDGSTTAPFAGVGDAGEIVTGGLEVYGSAQRGLYVIQQRSPALKTKKDEHVKLLSAFVQSSKFACTLVLTSLDAANQDDTQLLTPHQQIIPPSSPSSPIIDRLRTLPALSLTLASDRQPSATNAALEPSNKSYPPFLPAAGLTRRLLSALNSVDISHGCLTTWCVEGDNRGDAFALTELVLQLLDIGDVEMKEPKSWKGLFGVESGWSGGMGEDSELYG